MKINKFLLPGLVVVALLGVSSINPLHADAKVEVKTEQVATAKPMIIANVNGLVCDFCAQALRKVFKKQANVVSLDVDLDAGEVRITLKPGKTLDEAIVKELIIDSGYSYVSSERTGGA